MRKMITIATLMMLSLPAFADSTHWMPTLTGIYRCGVSMNGGVGCGNQATGNASNATGPDEGRVLAFAEQQIGFDTNSWPNNGNSTWYFPGWHIGHTVHAVVQVAYGPPPRARVYCHVMGTAAQHPIPQYFSLNNAVASCGYCSIHGGLN